MFKKLIIFIIIITGISLVSISSFPQEKDASFRNLLVDGKLGIRTSKPEACLDVKSGFMRLGPVSFPADYGYSRSSYLILDKTSTYDDASIVLRDSGNARAEIGIITDNNIHFKTVTGRYPDEKFHDRLIILSSGEVGIGTLSPVALFHVAGKVQAPKRMYVKIENTNTTEGRSAALELADSGGTARWVIGTDAGLNSRNNFFIQDENAEWPPRFFIDKNGNIGIGTLEPGDYKLAVKGSLIASSCNCSSSKNMKKDIQYLSESDYRKILEKLNKIMVTTYRWKEEFNLDNKLHIGIISEEAPYEIVTVDKKAVDTSDYLGFLLAALKAQQIQIQDLKEEINKLKNKL